GAASAIGFHTVWGLVSLPRSLATVCRGSRWLPDVIIGTLTASPLQSERILPAFLLGLADLMFQRRDFLFHLAHTHVPCFAARSVEEVNDPAGRAANENDEKAK